MHQKHSARKCFIVIFSKTGVLSNITAEFTGKNIPFLDVNCYQLLCIAAFASLFQRLCFWADGLNVVKGKLLLP